MTKTCSRRSLGFASLTAASCSPAAGPPQPLYHIVPITARVALHIVIHQNKRHEILRFPSGSSVAGTQVRAPPRPQVKTGVSNAFLLAFAAGESACHRWPKNFCFSRAVRWAGKSGRCSWQKSWKGLANALFVMTMEREAAAGLT